MSAYRRDDPPDEDGGPEECPCGSDNVDMSGEWSCPEAPGFCSVACQSKYEISHEIGPEDFDE